MFVHGPSIQALAQVLQYGHCRLPTWTLPILSVVGPGHVLAHDPTLSVVGPGHVLAHDPTVVRVLLQQKHPGHRERKKILGYRRQISSCLPA